MPIKTYEINYLWQKELILVDILAEISTIFINRFFF